MFLENVIVSHSWCWWSGRRHQIFYQRQAVEQRFSYFHVINTHIQISKNYLVIFTEIAINNSSQSASTVLIYVTVGGGGNGCSNNSNNERNMSLEGAPHVHAFCRCLLHLPHFVVQKIMLRNC